MSFLTTLLQRPAELSRLSRYTIANGLFYMGFGVVMLLAPQAVLELVVLTELNGYEPGLLRALGVTLTVIGYFYVMGGRTGAASFGLSTVVDRVLIPLFLLPLWLTGEVALGMVIAFAVLDPLLGVGAYLVWRSERT